MLKSVAAGTASGGWDVCSIDAGLTPVQMLVPSAAGPLDESERGRGFRRELAAFVPGFREGFVPTPTGAPA